MSGEVWIDEPDFAGFDPRNHEPTVAQWARAEALHEAREWYGSAFAAPTQAGAPVEIETVTIEALALRWARLIETGNAEARPDA